MTFEELLAESLSLPRDERARLAALLLGSLRVSAEIETAWFKEAERRLQEVKEGRAETFDAEEVHASVRARKS
jgi:putative addiction module component (TIGR02574 family)